MLFDLATAKARLGITDNTQDAQIQTELDAALAIAEAYCDRWFYHMPGQVEEFTHIGGTVLSLKRYPIDAGTVPTVVQGNGASLPTVHVERSTGLIRFDGRIQAHELTVTYDGGYSVLPDALVHALWGIFDMVRASGQSGGSALGQGVVKAVSSSGARVEFFDPSSGGGSVGIDENTGLPASIIGLLNLYRREHA